MSSNYPNPFNPSTTIKYRIPLNPPLVKGDGTNAGPVTLKVYDLLGREVAVLVNEYKAPGNYEVTWNAANTPSGVYFYRIQAGDFVQTRKMLLLK